MKGDDVRVLQDALKGKGYLQGRVDGEYGPDTARAVYRAKYWLGYRKPDGHASDLLYSYLVGRKKPTPLMKARTKNRHRIAKKEPVRLKMWAEAHKWIGTKEHPFGSNVCKFSIWYGVKGPWCAMFVTWCGVVAKSRAFRKGRNYAYCPNVVSDARAGHNNLAVTYHPLKGDLVLFDWAGGGADHIGLFNEWTSKNRSTFKSLEGNTGHTNASNGGEVLEMNRKRTNVVCFVHVGR